LRILELAKMEDEKIGKGILLYLKPIGVNYSSLAISHALKGGEKWK